MSGQDDLISVIVPAHNAERFIGEALTSALAQSHRALEVVESLGRSDPRVRLLRTPREGAAAARNRSVAEAWQVPSRGPPSSGRRSSPHRG